MDWNPDMSAAPRDGTWILVYEPYDGEPSVHVVQWAEPQWSGGDKTWVTMALGPNPDTYEADCAVAWMPLPPAPAATDISEK